MRWGFVFLWMILIFCFSHQPNSNEITKEVFGDWNYWVRKGAHVSEYLILYLLLHWAMIKRHPDRIKRGLIVGLLTILYSISDEMHQAFVPGRSAAVSDVLIDSIGVIVGRLLVFLHHRWWHKEGSDQTDQVDGTDA